MRLLDATKISEKKEKKNHVLTTGVCFGFVSYNIEMQIIKFGSHCFYNRVQTAMSSNQKYSLKLINVIYERS